MSKFFRIIIDTNVSDYARPNEEFYQQSLGKVTLVEACKQRQIQYLSRQTEEVELDDSGGLIFPDFMFYEDVLLVSEAAYDIFCEVYLPFEKPVILTFAALGLREKYHLLLPPQVRSLDEAGNYRVFALETAQVVVDDDLRKAIERAGLSNIYFAEMEE